MPAEKVPVFCPTRGQRGQQRGDETTKRPEPADDVAFLNQSEKEAGKTSNALNADETIWNFLAAKKMGDDKAR